MRLAWVCSCLTLANGFLAPQTFRPPRCKHTAPSTALRLSIDSSSPPVSASDSDGLVVGLNKYSHDSSVCILSYRWVVHVSSERVLSQQRRQSLNRPLDVHQVNALCSVSGCSCRTKRLGNARVGQRVRGRSIESRYLWNCIDGTQTMNEASQCNIYFPRSQFLRIDFSVS